MANLVLWIATAWWIAARADSLRIIDAATRQAVRLTSGSGEPSIADPGWAVLWVPVTVVVTGALMLASLLVGPRPFRTIRYWLLLVLALSAWASLAVAREDLYWAGQQDRIGRQLAAVEPVIEELRNDWPEGDSGTDSLGPYLAYPKSGPTTLLLATNAPLTGTQFGVAAVERTPTHAISLQLAGNESPAWLEWRPTDDEPQSFTSGLMTKYEMQQFEKLAPHWFLVRYKAGR